MYKINEIGDLKYITFSSLEKYDDLFHAFTSRFGGVSEGEFASMNLGFFTGDSFDNVMKNYTILSQKLDINLENIIKTAQTHTKNIRYVTELDKGKVFTSQDYKDIDGLFTDKKNLVLVTFHADCTPIFFYDEVKKIIGMAHAGWKGTLLNISGNMIDNFVSKFDSNPNHIKVVIGPSLGQCCFEVDEDVKERFLTANKFYENFMLIKGLKYHFNLWEINKYQLLNKGIKIENIEISSLCTKCRNDLFYSHRAQKGIRGLMCGMIMLK